MSRTSSVSDDQDDLDYLRESMALSTSPDLSFLPTPSSPALSLPSLLTSFISPTLSPSSISSIYRRHLSMASDDETVALGLTVDELLAVNMGRELQDADNMANSAASSSAFIAASSAATIVAANGGGDDKLYDGDYGTHAAVTHTATVIDLPPSPPAPLAPPALQPPLSVAQSSTSFPSYQTNLAPPVTLAPDFLTIPPTHAIQLSAAQPASAQLASAAGSRGSPKWHLTASLSSKVFQSHSLPPTTATTTLPLHHNPTSSFGLTLSLTNNLITVHALLSPTITHADLRPGAVVRGINDQVWPSSGGKEGEEMLRECVQYIKQCAPPILVHLSHDKAPVPLAPAVVLPIHALAEGLGERKLIREGDGGGVVSEQIYQHMSRGRMFEGAGGEGESKQRESSQRMVTTPPALLSETLENSSPQSADFATVRRIVCTRVLTVTGEEYSLLCYDPSCGSEWCFVKSSGEFDAFRKELIKLRPSIAQIGYWEGGESAEFSIMTAFGGGGKQDRRTVVDKWIRKVVTLVYTSSLHERSGEICRLVDEFLGGETGGEEGGIERAIETYTARIFLLPVLDLLCTQFVAALSASLPTNAQLITYVKRSEREKLKEVASEHLEKLVGFIAQVKSMIVEGCTKDMEAIALSGGFGRTEDLEHVISESVQRIVEIEVYVPLRSLLSRVIVNAYRKDDVLIQQRIQQLLDKDQAWFNIPAELQSPSLWATASSILKTGIGKSTLPSDKLAAIIRCAKEIMRLYKEEHPVELNKEQIPLGADDFLPVFIFTVLRSDLGRAASLLALLNGMLNVKIGETGYYLATFEAAVEHVKSMGEEEEEKAKEEEKAGRAEADELAEAGGAQSEGDSGKELEKLLAGSGFLG